MAWNKDCWLGVQEGNGGFQPGLVSGKGMGHWDRSGIKSHVEPHTHQSCQNCRDWQYRVLARTKNSISGLENTTTRRGLWENTAAKQGPTPGKYPRETKADTHVYISSHLLVIPMFCL